MSAGVGASCAELAQTGTIVGPQFCAPQPIHLAFTTEAPWLKDNHITVTDIHGKFILWGRSTCSLRSRHILYDSYNNPLISVQEKIRTVHGRWQAFIGDSSDPRNLLFSVKRSSMVQIKPEFDVFLASNAGEEVCDFKIKGSYRKRTCTVYKGDSQMALARMSKEQKAMSLPQGKHIFGVHINRNTDYCFIAALIVILHAICEDDDVGDVISGVIHEIAVDSIGPAIIQTIASSIGS